LFPLHWSNFPNPKRNRILPIRALEEHFILAAPRVFAPELHHVQVGEDIVIEETAEPAAVPASDPE
jgi:hypothetical protein